MTYGHQKKLVIVGGGMAGWVAAAALSRRLEPELCAITIVESAHIGNIHVGESVRPSVVSFLRGLGLSEHELIQKTQAGLKLGIQFEEWLEPGARYFHPFGRLGPKLGELDFFQYWLKARATGDLTPLTDYAPAAVMAQNGKFAFPFDLAPGSPLADMVHALHLDADLVVQYLRSFSERNHVKRINGHVVRVNKQENGSIESIELNSRQIVPGDFFIDCSGFRGLLIGETLGTPYESWKEVLPCDRAVVAQSAHSGQKAPYMSSTARDHGWTWQIPLQKRISHGHVFSSDHCSDDQAMQVLLQSMATEPVNEPHFIPFRTGMRNQLWKKNCVALGLAGGFLEPLESTAIQLITRGVQFLLELFPNLSQEGQSWPSLAAEYNALMRRDFEEVRDFICLHYVTTKRSDTEFWRRCQSAPMPDGLVEKIELFKTYGQVRASSHGLFDPPSWQAVLTGMGVIPRFHHPFADRGNFEEIHQQMGADRARLKAAVRALPVYRGILRE